MLTEFLNMELPDKCSVFLDENNLRPGGTFNEEIKRSLHRSRVIVPIFSTAYFRSEWCKAELDCVMRREFALGRRTQNKPIGLIFPVKLHDGKYYPKEVQNITYEDFSIFNHAAADSPFRQSQDYLEFRKLVRQFAINLVEPIMNTPPWDATFPELMDPGVQPDPIIIPQPRMF